MLVHLRHRLEADAGAAAQVLHVAGHGLVVAAPAWRCGSGPQRIEVAVDPLSAIRRSMPSSIPRPRSISTALRLPNMQDEAATRNLWLLLPARPLCSAAEASSYSHLPPHRRPGRASTSVAGEIAAGFTTRTSYAAAGGQTGIASQSPRARSHQQGWRGGDRTADRPREQSGKARPLTSMRPLTSPGAAHASILIQNICSHFKLRNDARCIYATPSARTELEPDALHGPGPWCCITTARVGISRGDDEHYPSRPADEFVYFDQRGLSTSSVNFERLSPGRASDLRAHRFRLNPGHPVQAGRGTAASSSSRAAGGTLCPRRGGRADHRLLTPSSPLSAELFGRVH